MTLEHTETVELTEMQERLKRKCAELGELLVQKNRAYGNSAFEERTGVFSKLPTIERIFCRMDDKLARIKMGQASALGEDSFLDLAGYLVILLVKMEMDREGAKEKVSGAEEHRCAAGKKTVRKVEWTEVFNKLFKILSVMEGVGNPKNGALPVKVFGIPRGGKVVLDLLKEIDKRHIVEPTDVLEEADIILDDCLDSGKTMQEFAEERRKHSTIPFATMALFGPEPGVWLKFPWESEDEIPASLRKHLNGADHV